jgi:flagellar hook-associated protein 1 FlgK
MDSMSIALTALRAAQSGLDIAGNNIANAATEGYHRQRVEFTPAYSSELNGFLIGGGVNVTNISRIIDTVLEKQLTRQYSLSGQANTELDTLSTVEAAFGELSAGGGLSTAIDDFFNSFSDLSADPSAGHLQTQVVSTAESMGTQFRTLGTFLSDLSASIVQKAYTATKQINEYAEQIAELNYQIRDISLKGGTTNNLMDERDARISKLAELVGITTIERDDGAVDVGISGSWLVIGSSVQEMDVAMQENGMLGIAPVGTTVYNTELEGGSLGAYFNLNNTSLVNIREDLDTLAQSIITRVNGYHVQGLSSGGSFTELVGFSMAAEALSDFQPPVTSGEIYVRVTDLSTGDVTRTAVSVDASTDTLTTMAAKLNAVLGIGAWVESGKLHIEANPDFTFDFLPTDISSPSDTDTSGFLAAAGINAFFSGSSTRDIAVSSFVSDDHSNIATSLGADLTDNANALRLSRMSTEELAALGEVSIGDYYRQLVTDVGTDISIRQLRVDNIDTVTKNLKAQWEASSGIDINDEAAKMLVFERMFQASARYLNTVQSAMDEVMRLL